MIACYSMLFCFLIDVIEHMVGIFINLVSKKELMVLRRKKLTCSWQAIHTIVMTGPSLKLLTDLKTFFCNFSKVLY